MHGFYRIAAAAPKCRPGDWKGNLKALKEAYKEADQAGASIVVFPELAISGAGCGSLYAHDGFMAAAYDAANELVNYTRNCVAVFGVPVPCGPDAVSAAYVAKGGELIDMVMAARPGCHDLAQKENRIVEFMGDFGFQVMVGDDAWCNGDKLDTDAIICIGSDEPYAGRAAWRRRVLAGSSAAGHRLEMFCNAGSGVATGDRGGDGDIFFCCDGEIISEGSGRMTFADIDMDRIGQRRRWHVDPVLDADTQAEVGEMTRCGKPLYVDFPKMPYLSRNESERNRELDEIVEIASSALALRVERCGAKTMVLGVSGGLDSTLALVICCRACDMLGLPHSAVHAVSMPGFGSTGRTAANARTICEELETGFEVVDITEACRIHLRDIGHDGRTPDAVFENSQARERTQVLMDIANRDNGIVVGTGDLSEGVLGWCTFNGDQMSMFNVNSSTYKSQIPEILKREASRSTERLAKALLDVVDTPISPELIPGKDGEITQKTEEVLGPYLLHDFFIHYYFTGTIDPETLDFMAKKAFHGVFDNATIEKTLATFMHRMTTQQFKRNASPDGVRTTEVTLSPRTGWRMPSDLHPEALL
ncbi:MAG: NAD(+) synthase [Victivallaceae bacterium]|nr:NAD(+) synthase [Victivallaceae bacterium]